MLLSLGQTQYTTRYIEFELQRNSKQLSAMVLSPLETGVMVAKMDTLHAFNTIPMLMLFGANLAYSETFD